MPNPLCSTCRANIARCSTLLALAACSSAPAVPYQSDVVPGFDRASLACIVLLSHDAPGSGTGILVAPNRVLTARHVVDAIRGDATSTFRMRIGRAWAVVRVVAQGEVDAPHGDWALLEANDANWPPELLAMVHPEALDPTWRPAAGAAVVMAGFASNFFPDKCIDDRWVPIVATHVLDAARLPDDVDQAWFVASRGLVLSGMSGGAVFLPPEPGGQPRLIGVFTGTTTNEDALEGPFGLRIGIGRESADRCVRLPAAALAR